MSTLDTLFSDCALYFIPLGGSEQFGVNLNVYIADGDMLAIDCGIGFADDTYPGIDLLLPDPAFIEEYHDHLKGIIITHAHEDHIGALAHLWERFACPIYATPFTAAVLQEKFKERNLRKVPITVVDLGKTIKIGKFEVQFVPVSHSVPDTCSLIMKTPQGCVVHSGDWNLDPRPVVGKVTDSKAFKAAGEQGVLAYIGDSTNAEVDGRAGSESDVEIGLEAEFKKCTGKIAVTTFSSNIGRVRSIAKAAAACDRQVAIVGRSLHRMIGCAIDCGILRDVPPFINLEDCGYIPDEKLVLIATGSQGEYRAALSKISRGDFQGVKLKRGDTVIFSARAIPGNEKSINQVKNNLSAAGINIVTPRDTKNIIHVSGHPCRGEIQEMLQWLRPQLVVPVHGERVQLDAHAAFAQECQVPQTIVPSNGSVIRLAPGKPELIAHVPTDILALDQKRLIKADHQSISARRKLQYTGAIHVSMALDDRGEVLGKIKLETVGLIDEDTEADEQIETQIYDEILALMEELTWDELRDDHFIAEELRIGIRRFCQHILGMKPKTTVHVLRV